MAKIEKYEESLICEFEEKFAELVDYITHTMGDTIKQGELTDEQATEINRLFRNIFGTLEFVEETLDSLNTDYSWRKLLKIAEEHPL